MIAALLASAASFATREPLAQSVEELQGNPTERLVTPRTLRPHGSARSRASLARATSGPDSIWIGHSIQTRATRTAGARTISAVATTGRLS